MECGANFPLIGELEALLRESVIKATIDSPLRHNSVETFDEYNTGKNVGKGTPTVFWRSFRIPTSAASTPIWLAAAARCRVKRWY